MKLRLGSSPAIDSYPQAYTGTITCLQVTGSVAQCGSKTKAQTKLNTEDMIPVETNFDQAAAAVLAASDSALSRGWSLTNQAPDGSEGWWGSVGAEAPGDTFMWTANDMPDLAAYGLISAALCAPSGTHCIQPSLANVTEALNSATKDSTGLLQVDPAKVPAGAFPLVDVVYAAVPLDQPAATLSNYADLLAYAAGPGQTIGSAPGDLPPGYLPLPAGLQAQAQAVIRQLRAIAHPTPTPTPTHSATPTHSPTRTQSALPTTTAPTTPASTTPTSPGGTTTTPGPTAGASATPTTTHGGAGAPTTTSPSAQGPVILAPSAELAGGTTPPNEVGGIRLALVVVLIIGAAGALGGTVLRYGRMPKVTRSRRRPDGT